MAVLRRRLLLGGGGGQRYIRRVLGVCGDSLIGYWPLNEAAGSTARDWSGNGHDGTYTGVDLADAAGIGDGQPAPYFDGTSSIVNVLSAGLQAAFVGASGSMFCWSKVANAAIWTNGVGGFAMAASVDPQNTIFMAKGSTNNRVTLVYEANDANKRYDIPTSDTGWQFWCLTWDLVADQVRAYLDGTQQGVTLTSLGTWAGTLTGANVGGSGTKFIGWLAHGGMCDRALTPAEIAALSNP